MAGPHRRDRPFIPGYGIPETDDGLLDWTWADRELRDAIVYWVSSSRPDGRPHSMPTWGAWVDDGFWFEGGVETRRARNLEVDPRAVVAIGGDAFAVIVEGRVERRPDPDPQLSDRLVEGFRKYVSTRHAYQVDPANWSAAAGGGLWVLRPTVAFGWQEYPRTCTRWHFG